MMSSTRSPKIALDPKESYKMPQCFSNSRLFLHFLPLLIAPFCCSASESPASDRYRELTLPQLEERLVEIDAELARLPTYSLRGGLGTKGFRSKGHSGPENTEWIQIHLGEAIVIDQVVLVPTILRDTKRGFVDEGFPKEFRIIAGLNSTNEGTVVASYSEEDQLLPRIAPVVSSFPAIPADWVRIEATKLSPRGFEGWFFLQLAEIFVFSGVENVALRKPVTTSSETPDDIPIYQTSWKPAFVVDGFVPYLMDAQEGEQSLAFVGYPDTRPTFTADLGASIPVNRIHLHTVEQNNTVPLTTIGDYGLPKRLKLYGADKEDFSDASILIDYVRMPIRDTGPILLLSFPERSCRYVRLVAEPEEITIGNVQSIAHVGFAEIELFSRGHNVLAGKPISTNLIPENPARSVTALTDGLNFLGKILPIRDWLGQLAYRHELEAERPFVVAELKLRHARQNANFRLMYLMIGLLLLVTCCSILVQRIWTKKQIMKARERFAADLHDEIGANLHTISLLGDVAQSSLDNPFRLTDALQRSRSITQQTSDVVRHYLSLQNAVGLSSNLPEEMRRSIRRIMTNIEHEFSVTGEEHLNDFRVQRKLDLLLFHKECLVNICRHSGATRSSTILRVTKNEIRLTVEDNGCGLPKRLNGTPPSSLARRAKLLKADIDVATSNSGGTRITLTCCRRGRFRLWR